MTVLVRTPPEGQLAIAVVASQGVITVWDDPDGFRVDYTFRGWGGQAWQQKTESIVTRDVGAAIRVLLTGRDQAAVDDVLERINAKLAAREPM